MTVSLATGSIVAKPGQAISLSSMVSVTAGSDNPKYLVVSGLDRNEYTVDNSGSTGVFSGNGHSTGFTSIGGDALGAGIVFTYDATSGQYVNAIFGKLSGVVLTASRDTNRNEAISIYSSNDPYLLAQYANNSYSMSRMANYIGTVDVVTQPNFTQTAAQATPSTIASIATSFVGQAWNQSGCWVLASNICAEAGASLPISTTSVGVAGVSNGPWIVAYNAPAGASGDWQSSLRAGDLVVYGNASGGGHITTVVSGYGAGAMVVDNLTQTNASGGIVNSANDGSQKDIIITSPYLASAQFAQANPGSVVVYRLDTPIVSAVSAIPVFASQGTSLQLSSLVSASDPGARSVTQYQVYDTGTDGAANSSFLVNGAMQSAHSASSAITVAASDLSKISWQANGASGVDTLQVRAFNGAYWGDWQQISINLGEAPPAPVAAFVPPAAAASAVSSVPTPLRAPVVTAQTANQVWRSRRAVGFSLAANTFTDPQGLGMTYQTYQIGGPTLNKLRFDSASATFSGSVQNGGRSTVTLAVVATNSAGLSATETFNVTLAPTAARFAQAMASVNSGAGVAGAIAGPAPAVSSLHSLYAPIANAR